MKYFSRNKRALHDYLILRRFEAGIVLLGDEVKSIRNGQVNLTAAYAIVSGSNLELLNCHISSYANAYKKIKEIGESRTRRLLVHAKELQSLAGEISTKGVTLIPLAFYENEKGYIKVEVAVCKHKKSYERKEEIRERDIARATRRELKGKYNY